MTDTVKLKLRIVAEFTVDRSFYEKEVRNSDAEIALVEQEQLELDAAEYAARTLSYATIQDMVVEPTGVISKTPEPGEGEPIKGC